MKPNRSIFILPEKSFSFSTYSRCETLFVSVFDCSLFYCGDIERFREIWRKISWASTDATKAQGHSDETQSINHKKIFHSLVVKTSKQLCLLHNFLFSDASKTITSPTYDASRLWLCSYYEIVKTKHAWDIQTFLGNSAEMASWNGKQMSLLILVVLWTFLVAVVKQRISLFEHISRC